jgi:predicted  nucleic acid-binding Zn-ribbon protein
MGDLESDAIAREVEQLEGKLSALRSRVETDSTSFSALESQLADLRERLAETQATVREHEQRLSDKQAELAEAKRLERLAAYEENLDRHQAAGGHVADAASALLDALDDYDKETVALRKLADEMRTTFGEDERVAQVEGTLENEPERLSRSWEAIVAAVSWRIQRRAEPEDVKPDEETISEDLQRVAEERRRMRIMEYFGKS